MLKKLREDRPTGILVLPLWGTQPWFPLLRQLHVETKEKDHATCRTRDTAAQAQTDETVPYEQQTDTGGLSDVAAQTGEDLVYSFNDIWRLMRLPQRIWPVLYASWDKSTHKQYTTYLKQWGNFCNAHHHNPLKPHVNDLLEFLHDLFDKGKSYSTIASARSCLSAFIVMDGQPISDLIPSSTSMCMAYNSPALLYQSMYILGIQPQCFST